MNAFHCLPLSSRRGSSIACCLSPEGALWASPPQRAETSGVPPVAWRRRDHMTAAADYSAAARLLKAPLPAYVTYVERSYATAFSHTKDTSQTIVIRTRDGAVIKGDPSKVKISTDRDIAVNPVSHPPFDAACYVPRAATSKQWNDRTVEAIALRDTWSSSRRHPDRLRYALSRSGVARAAGPPSRIPTRDNVT